MPVGLSLARWAIHPIVQGCIARPETSVGIECLSEGHNEYNRLPSLACLAGGWRPENREPVSEFKRKRKGNGVTGSIQKRPHGEETATHSGRR